MKHDNTVTCLAFRNDPISQKDFKYVFLAASSALKGQSDKEKYEKSRKTKVGKFSLYVWGFLSHHSPRTYLTDKLALQAGNEKVHLYMSAKSNCGWCTYRNLMQLAGHVLIMHGET